MIKVDVSKDDAEKIRQALSSLSGRELHAALGASGKRAARHGMTVGAKKMREVYTIKSGVAKSRMKVENPSPLDTVIRIEGGTEPVKNFRGTRRRKDGVFVSIKRDSGGVVPRSFMHGDAPLMREGAERYPLKGVYGPSVPQMFDDESVIETTMDAMAEKYEERIMHELERRTGGKT